MDWSLLSDDELSDFYRLHNVSDSTPPDVQFRNDVLPLPVRDLYIASQVKSQIESTQTYTIKQLNNMSSEKIASFAHAFGLDLNDPDVVDRIKRILRFLGLIHNSLVHLPDELIHNILLETPYADVIHLCRTNKRISQLCRNPYLWMLKLREDYKLNIIYEDQPQAVYRQLYSLNWPCCDNNILIKASERGYVELVNVLLEDERVDPSSKDNLAIYWASRNGHSKVVKRLLEDERVDPSTRNNEAIRCASYNGHLEVVKRLLQDPRVNPSDQNNLVIMIASQNGHLDVVKKLLEDGRVDPSARNNSAIYWASRNDHLDVVKRLLEDDRVRSTQQYII